MALSKWCLQESNQGHKDFQSFALPTELRHLLIWDCKYKTFFNSQKLFFIFSKIFSKPFINKL